MKLSTRARYGLSCMISIARLSDESHPVSLKRVADSTGVSRRYLEQLALPLKAAGLLHGVSGRGGGYRLARDAGTIRLREIVEATIGPISIVDCVADPGLCERAESCENRLIYLLINDRICEVLDEYTLADLADFDRLSRLCLALGRDPSAVAGERRPDGVSELCLRILERQDDRTGPE